MDCKKNNIALIGMPGCGKSTIGKLISKGINFPFYDVDEYIEQNQGKSIKDIFKENGEEFFREIETDTIKEIVKNNNIVISTGGGVVERKKNIDFLKKNSIIIFINRPIKNIIDDINISNRPLLKEGKEKLFQIYNKRINLYTKYSDFIVDNYQNLQVVVDKIMEIYKMEVIN